MTMSCAITTKETLQSDVKTINTWFTIYIYYCKCRKSKGNPIIMKFGKEKHFLDSVKILCNSEMKFNNSPRDIARSGATTVLVIKEAEKKLTFDGSGGVTIEEVKN